MWSDKEFRERVSRRARALGKSKRQVCIEAGIALDTLEKIPTSGRRIDTLSKLAAALDWSLAEIMGHPAGERVTAELLGRAFAIAKRGLGRNDDQGRLIGTTARVYNLLADRRRAGLPLDDTGWLTAYIATDTAANPEPAPPLPAPAQPAGPQTAGPEGRETVKNPAPDRDRPPKDG